jgi:hypothetical protein
MKIEDDFSIIGATVPLKIGDSVRIKSGDDGKIVVMAKDGVSAYVMLTNDGKGAHASLYRLDSLTKIEGPA